MTDTGNQTSTPPAANPDLLSVHRRLIGLVADLERSIGRAKTAAEVNAILDEIAEVNARVTAVGRQLFTQQTRQIAARAKAVEDAVADVKKAVDELESVKKLVQGVTHFLSLVDKLIDVAKLVF